MGPLGYVCLQCLLRPHGSVVGGDYLLYTRLYKECGWMPNPPVRIPSVFCCLEARNDRRDGALRISLVVSLAVPARSSSGVAVGGGLGACAVVA